MVKDEKFFPCNLDSNLLILGDTILVTGEIKEIYPYEKVIATPIKLTSAFRK